MYRTSLETPHTSVQTPDHGQTPCGKMEEELKNKGVRKFCTVLRGRLTALIEGSRQSNLLGANSFFDRFTAFK